MNASHPGIRTRVKVYSNLTRDSNSSITVNVMLYDQEFVHKITYNIQVKIEFKLRG